MKKPARRLRRAGFPYSKHRVVRFPTLPVPGEVPWGARPAGLLARASSSGPPSQPPWPVASWPFVSAHSGGSAGDSHPTSLLSPQGTGRRPNQLWRSFYNNPLVRVNHI